MIYALPAEEPPGSTVYVFGVVEASSVRFAVKDELLAEDPLESVATFTFMLESTASEVAATPGSAITPVRSARPKGAASRFLRVVKSALKNLELTEDPSKQGTISLLMNHYEGGALP